MVSSKLMNKIIGLDTKSSILSCQSGCILQSLTDYLDPYGLIMPLDLGAKGSCHIGGNVSTNAGLFESMNHFSIQIINEFLTNGDRRPSTTEIRVIER